MATHHFFPFKETWTDTSFGSEKRGQAPVFGEELGNWWVSTLMFG